ncbi:hypothetical protein NMY22_g11647 [Coprinellus aureogranulatus]|nr:hypothetical protein NMY22_g11647 [Coprinellus aureogranulatus]
MRLEEEKLQRELEELQRQEEEARAEERRRQELLEREKRENEARERRERERREKEEKERQSKSSLSFGGLWGGKASSFTSSLFGSVSPEPQQETNDSAFGWADTPPLSKRSSRVFDQGSWGVGSTGFDFGAGNNNPTTTNSFFGDTNINFDTSGIALSDLKNPAFALEQETKPGKDHSNADETWGLGDQKKDTPLEQPVSPEALQHPFRAGEGVNNGDNTADEQWGLAPSSAKEKKKKKKGKPGGDLVESEHPTRTSSPAPDTTDGYATPAGEGEPEPEQANVEDDFGFPLKTKKKKKGKKGLDTEQNSGTATPMPTTEEKGGGNMQDELADLLGGATESAETPTTEKAEEDWGLPVRTKKKKAGKTKKGNLGHSSILNIFFVCITMRSRSHRYDYYDGPDRRLRYAFSSASRHVSLCTLYDALLCTTSAINYLITAEYVDKLATLLAFEYVPFTLLSKYQPLRRSEDRYARRCPLAYISRMSFVSVLPLEVIHNIFALCGVDKSDFTVDWCTITSLKRPLPSYPIFLTSVCKSWTSAALSCRPLWSTISVRMGEEVRKSCPPVDVVEAWIRRAGPMPLSISIMPHTWRQDGMYYADSRDGKEALENLLLSYRTRWRRVALWVSPSAFSPVEFFKCAGDCTALKSASIWGLWETESIVHLLGNAPHLRDLHLEPLGPRHRYRMPPLSGQLIEDAMPWKRLRILRLGLLGGRFDNAEDVLQLLRECPQLEAMTTSMVRPRTPDAISNIPLVHHDHLKELDFGQSTFGQSMVFMDHVVFPNLTSVVLNPYSNFEEHPFEEGNTWGESFPSFISRSGCKITELGYCRPRDAPFRKDSPPPCRISSILPIVSSSVTRLVIEAGKHNIDSLIEHLTLTPSTHGAASDLHSFVCPWLSDLTMVLYPDTKEPQAIDYYTYPARLFRLVQSRLSIPADNQSDANALQSFTVLIMVKEDRRKSGVAGLSLSDVPIRRLIDGMKEHTVDCHFTTTSRVFSIFCGGASLKEERHGGFTSPGNVESVWAALREYTIYAFFVEALGRLRPHPMQPFTYPWPQAPILPAQASSRLS